MEPVIHIRGVQKSFPGPQGRLPVLQDIDLDVAPAEFITIVGRSGCGKSTLLRILCGLETADDGTVERRGAPVTGPGADCGMVFQDHRLLSWLTVADNVAFGLRQVPRAQKRALVAEYLNLVGLADYAKSYPAQLSGGMAQRAAIARTLMRRQPIMIFDDSLSAVDTETDAKIRAELERRFGSASIILISHRITTLAKAGQILVLDKGRIAERGTHDELVAANGIYRKIYDIQTAGAEEAAK